MGDQVSGHTSVVLDVKLVEQVTVILVHKLGNEAEENLDDLFAMWQQVRGHVRPNF